MVTATFEGTVIARSATTHVVEGNHYFPPESVNKDFLRESDHHTTCGWKGVASYYDVVVGDAVASNAAWYYPAVKPAAAEIGGHLAFWRGVVVKQG